MKLAELQDAFWQLAACAAAEPEASALFVATPALDAGSRIAIYADMFVARQIDCLREDYPKLMAAMPEAERDAFAQAYVRAHPSRHHSLAKLGQHVSEFVAAYPASRQDLCDLARLEWARVEVFDEQDVETAALSTLDEIARSDQSLAIVPALRALRLEHEVVDLWNAVEQGSPAPAPIRAPSALVVWRKDYDVFHTAIATHESEALSRAIGGAPLSVICAAFEACTDPVGAAFRALGSWFTEGWIANRSKRNSI